MPIFVEWKWVNKTETFLAVFHFWDDGTKQNLRMRKQEYGYERCMPIDETCDDKNITPGQDYTTATSIPTYIGGPTKHDAYLSWAPSHPEFCFLTELLTYANLVNGFKPANRKDFRSKLQGKTLTQERDGKKYIDSFLLDPELTKILREDKIVTFAGQWGISFEVCLPYVEYVRKLLKPYI
jgi:hypothetical protein